MSLEAGQKLSHYRLREQIGEGGMGVVWRASDTQLERDVAIKFLPESFAENAERLARFEREAKLLATLNHPNIGQVYGLVEHAGRSGIVLEYVAGETLADRISRGPLAEPEAREIAIQIAEALEEAHERGIVHRDLKPANVKITPQGMVKVLDFGLAKTLETESGTEPQDPAQSPTLTAMASQAGVVMGTAAYMAPEQAKGQPVDRRADVWAFGCVLYEMLIGRSPFEAKDVTEIMARVITLEPDLTALPDSLHAQIDELIRRCLRKDVRMRLSDMGTARIALQEAGETPQSGAGEQVSGSGNPTPASFRILAAVSLLSLTLGAGLSWIALRPAPQLGSSAAVRHYDVVLDPPAELREMALSADGRILIYTGRGTSGERMLYLRELDAIGSRALDGTEGGNTPFLSPDEQQVGFFAAGKLKRVSLRGGLPVTLCAAAGAVCGAVWLPDDQILFSTNSTVVPHRVAAAGGVGEPVRVRDLPEDLELLAPRLLPGAPDTVLVTVEGSSLDGPHVGVLNLENGSWQALVRGLDARLLASGDLLFAQRDRIVCAPFDLDSLQLTGPERAVPLAQPAICYRDLSPRFYSALAHDGSLTYPVGSFGERRLSRVNPDGTVTPLEIAGEGANLDTNGRRMLVRSKDGLHVVDLESNERTLWTDSVRDWYPRWLDDGSMVVSCVREGRRVVVRASLDGSDVVQLTDREWSPVPTSVGPDGTVMGYSIDRQNGRDIWIVSPKGEFEMVRATRHNERAGVICPMGGYFAYVSDEDGSDEIFIRALTDDGRRWRVSEAGGTAPVWSRDGRELLYCNGESILARSVTVEGNAVRLGPVRNVFTSERLNVEDFGNPTFDVAPDGALIVSLIEPRQFCIRVVLNWRP